METIEYRNPTVDKSTWGSGPWQDEPDKKQWLDARTGLPCLIVRNIHGSGALCGYVGVPRTHPLYEKGYDEADIEVHGGLTYADRCQEVQNHCEGICHKAPEGDDDIWWSGFDCAHYRDLSPLLRHTLSKYPGCLPEIDMGETYKTMAYVTAEVEKLALQLKAAE